MVVGTHKSTKSVQHITMTGFYSHQQQAAGVSDSIFFVCSTWSTRRGEKNNKHITARKRKSCKTENGLSGGGIRNEKKKENQEIEPAGPVFATRLTPVTVIKIKPRLWVSECVVKRVLYIYTYVYLYNIMVLIRQWVWHCITFSSTSKWPSERAGKWKPDYSRTTAIRYLFYLVFLSFFKKKEQNKKRVSLYKRIDSILTKSQHKP